jgi:hypothetical protein
MEDCAQWHCAECSAERGLSHASHCSLAAATRSPFERLRCPVCQAGPGVECAKDSCRYFGTTRVNANRDGGYMDPTEYCCCCGEPVRACRAETCELARAIARDRPAP